MTWLSYAFFAAASYGIYNFFTRLAGVQVSPAIGLISIGVTNVVMGVIAASMLRLTGHALTSSPQGIAFAVGAGVFAGIAELAYLRMFASGAELGTGVTIVVGGTIFVGAILGFLFLREAVTPTKLAGIALAILAIFLLSKSS